MTTTDIILLAGFAVVAAGFGYRNLLASVVGRIVLLLGGQIKTGDRISVAGTEGIVDQINLRCTVLRTLDNVLLYIPNSMWLSSPVTHWSAGDRSRRIRLPITLPADADLGYAASSIRRAAEQTTGIASKPSPRALIVGIEPQGVKLELWAWLSEPRSIGRSVDELGRNVQNELSGRGPSRRRFDSTPSRSRNGRDDRDSRDSRDSRGNRRERSSGDRPRRNARRDDSNSAATAAPVNRETRTERPSPEPEPMTTAVEPAVEPTAPAPTIAAAEKPREVEPETISQAAPEKNSSASDNGDSTETVTYGRSKRRVPRR